MALTKSQWERLPPQVKARYPKPKSNFGLILIGLSASIAILLFVGLGFQKYVNLPAAGKLTGFVIVDATLVQTNFEVNRDPGTVITCALRAQDERRIDVGYALVEIAPSDQRISALSYPLATRDLAVLVEVLGCSVGSEVRGVPLPQIAPGTELPEQPAPGRRPANL